MISNFEFNKTQIQQCFEDQIASYFDPYYQNQLFVYGIDDINNFIHNYWLCDICFSDSSCNSFNCCNELMKTMNSCDTQLSEHASVIDSNQKINVSQNKYQKRRFLDTIDFESNIARLLTTVKRVLNENKVMIHKKKKSTARRLVSNRRSQYTGVFKMEITGRLLSRFTNERPTLVLTPKNSKQQKFSISIRFYLMESQLKQTLITQRRILLRWLKTLLQTMENMRNYKS